MLGGDEDVSITLATAIELLHTATLVHDDLIDGSLLRRGSPTLNSQWSPAATVLTGDFIFARAAKMAANTNSVEVMKLFAQTLTTIVNGELTQLFTNRCVIDRDDYFRRIYAKTASLFETSASSAALISQADEATLKNLGEYGYAIGVAFQIVDDILDFTGEQTILGKPVGSDLRQGIITLPTIQYLQDHPEDHRAQQFFNQGCSSVNGWLDPLIQAIGESDAITKSYQVACDYVQNGINSLRKLPDLPERYALEELAEYIVARQV
jgi:geranylgeranyl pyrophosphate synthase